MIKIQKITQTFWRQLFLVVSGVYDSMKFRTSFQRYCLTSKPESKEILQTFYQSFKHLFSFIFIFMVINYLMKQFSLFSTQLMENKFVSFLIDFAYVVLLVFPFYLATTIYTIFWFGDISNQAAILERELYNNENFKQGCGEIEVVLANNIKKIVFMVIYFLSSFIINLTVGRLMFIGTPCIIVLYSLYYSLFLFLLQWNYNRFLLAYFEINLSYFIGFGFVYSFITIFFQGVMNDAIYWILFPVFILNSTNSEPPSDTQTVQDFQSFQNALSEYQLSKKAFEQQQSSFANFTKKVLLDPNYQNYCIQKRGFFHMVRDLTDYINVKLDRVLKTTTTKDQKLNSSQIKEK